MFPAAPIPRQRCGVALAAAPVPHVSGYVTENGLPVAKLIRVHARSDGSVLGETTSNATTGYYSIVVNPSVTTYVVAFDEPTFNALIFDGVVPG